MVLTDVTNRPRKRRKHRQLRYFGDYKQEDIEDPLIRKQYWHISQRAVAVCKKKIRNLQRKNKQITSKIHSLEAPTRHLRENNLISERIVF
nr:unnamed protein product [Callosobruchus analis]